MAKSYLGKNQVWNSSVVNQTDGTINWLNRFIFKSEKTGLTFHTAEITVINQMLFVECLHPVAELCFQQILDSSQYAPELQNGWGWERPLEATLSPPLLMYSHIEPQMSRSVSTCLRGTAKTLYWGAQNWTRMASPVLSKQEVSPPSTCWYRPLNEAQEAVGFLCFKRPFLAHGQLVSARTPRSFSEELLSSYLALST